MADGTAAFLDRCLRCAAVLALGALALAAPAAHAQAPYPNRVIRIIVPYSAGGGGDIVSRMLAERLTRTLGEQVIVDNRPGAGGNIGTHQASQAKPDGYTLVLAPDGNVLIAPLIYDNLPYDPMKDLAPVAKIGDIGIVLVTSPGSKIKTLADVQAMAKADSAGLSYATAGVGSAPHIFMESYIQRTGTKLVHVPYKGGAAAITDVMGNQIPLLATTLPSAMPHIKSGKLVPIAVSTQARSRSLPDVPTFIESGNPDLFYNTWFAIFGPAGIPKPIVDKLNAEMVAAFKSPDINEKLTDMGIVVTPITSEAFATELKRDLERLRPIVKKAGIKAE